MSEIQDRFKDFPLPKFSSICFTTSRSSKSEKPQKWRKHTQNPSTELPKVTKNIDPLIGEGLREDWMFQLVVPPLQKTEYHQTSIIQKIACTHLQLAVPDEPHTVGSIHHAISMKTRSDCGSLQPKICNNNMMKSSEDSEDNKTFNHLLKIFKNLLSANITCRKSHNQP